MYVQQVEFDLQGMSAADYEAFCEQAVPAIAQVPGVVAKLFVADTGSGRCAGIYTFEDSEAAEAYLQSDLFQTAIVGNPQITNLQIRGGALLEGPTRALDDALASAAGSPSR
jgi:hypothetical protein